MAATRETTGWRTSSRAAGPTTKSTKSSGSSGSTSGRRRFRPRLKAKSADDSFWIAGSGERMMKRRLRVTMSAAAAFAVVALSRVPAAQQVPPDGKSWVGHTPKGVRDPNLPPDEDAAKEQLAKSMLKSEWVSISMSNGPVLKAFIVHPELTRLRPRAGVVVVIHDKLGLTDWVRGVADQLARHGFIAVAPDLLSGKGPNGGGTDTLGGGVGPAIDGLTQ